MRDLSKRLGVAAQNYIRLISTTAKGCCFIGWTILRPSDRRQTLKIYLTQVFVDDQQHALDFYTSVLGFVKKHDVPLGQHRWLTVASSADQDGMELLLEPSSHPAVTPFRDAMMKDGIPSQSFQVDGLEREHERLMDLGVKFIQPPVAYEGYATAVFDDTCGNLIQLIEMSNKT